MELVAGYLMLVAVRLLIAHCLMMVAVRLSIAHCLMVHLISTILVDLDQRFDDRLIQRKKMN